MSDNSQEYEVVTVISHFRSRYVVPVGAFTAKDDLTVEEQINNAVLEGKVKEFSQTHLSEDIVGHNVMDVSMLIPLFDTENDYLASWSLDKKISWINNWGDDITK